MLAINYSQFRENMKSNMDLITDDCETIIVTRKQNRNIVMISESAYNNFLENLHLMREPANYEWLLESKRQLESGNFEQHELIEVPDE